MAKIEEVTALLIDEIEGFNQSIQNLSKLNNSLQNTTIKTDNRDLEQTLQRFYKQYETLQIGYKEELTSLQNEINTAVIIPKWMTTVFISLCSLFLISVFLNFYQFKQKDSIKSEGFNDGKREIENHIMKFFEENPKTEKTYRNWLKKKQ